MRLSDEHIQRITDNVVTRNLKVHKEKKRVYRRNRIPLGKIKRRNGNYSGVYYLDFDDKIRMTIQGMTQSGKSFLLRGLIDRMSRAGYHCVYVPDVKDEFKTSLSKGSMDFQDQRLSREKPEMTPIATLRPTLFSSLRLKKASELPKDNHWFSFDPLSLSKEEWKTLLKIEGDTQQKNFYLIVEQTLNRIDEMSDEEKSEVNVVEEFIHTVSLMDNIKETYKASYVGKLKPLLNNKMFVKEYRLDLVELLREGLVVALNMKYHQRFDSNLRYHIGVFLIFFRMIVEAKMSGELRKPVFVAIDEATRFIPDDDGKRFESTDYVDESVELHTAYDLNYAFSCQTLERISSTVIQNSRYILVPYSASTQDFNRAIKDAGVTSSGKAYALASRIKNNCDRFDWMIVDNKKSSWDIIRPLPPLSKHG